MEDFIDASKYIELNILECGKEECVKNKINSLSKKDCHLFHYVLIGKGTLVINKNEYHLNKGDIFFIERNTDATYFADNENPWTYEWVGFGGNKADDILKVLDINNDNPIIRDKGRSYRRYFDAIINGYNETGYLGIACLGALYQLLGEMMYEKEGLFKLGKGDITVQLAKNFINNNYQFDISIEDIAKNANVTPNYLSAAFVKKEGMTTKKYLTKVRMEKALSLLQSGKFKIKEVAELVGYPNQLHFSSEFKKYYGVSPSEYL